MTTLRIEQTGLAADRFRADVHLLADGGQARKVRSEFLFVMTDADHADLRWYMEDYLDSPFEPEQQVAARVERRMRAIGELLFNALFTDHDGIKLWGAIHERLDTIRVEVVSEIQDATLVPWELLREPNSPTPLAVAVQEFVRSHLHARRMSLATRSDELPIRVLLVICRPGRNRDVPFRSVASRLVKSLTDDSRKLLQLDVLRPATFDRLAEVLRQAHTDGRPYHVVHFDGHGAFVDLEQAIRQWQQTGGDMPRELADVLDIDPQRYSPKTIYPHTPTPGRHGYLVFENPRAETNTRLADGGEIGRLLVETQVPVLVLNACRSAHAEANDGSRSHQTSDDATEEPNSGESGYTETIHEQVRALGSLAHQVSHEGVSGVVAMRYNVYVVTAAEFVADLYAELVQGRSLGQAATLARKGLADDPLRTIAYDPVPLQDWPVPVVFESFPIKLFPAKETGGPKLNLHVSSSRPAEAGALDAALPKPPDVGFFGRDETLLELDRSFDSHPVVLLHAFAGSGKTQAAAEFARWYALTGGVQGPVLFTSFETYRPLPRVLDRIGEVFGAVLEQNGIHWLALDDGKRRDLALQVMQQVPVLWIWDNVEPVTGFASTYDGLPRPSSPDTPTNSNASTALEGHRTDTVYKPAERQALADFLRDAGQTQAKFLLTSRRDERPWLGDLPRRIAVGPMPMHERVQLAQALAEKLGRKITDFAVWRPLLRFTEGNPLTLTVVVGQALRDGLQTKEQIEAYVQRLRSGEAAFTDETEQGRSRSLGASLSYGFEHAFSPDQRRILALLHLFQGFVNVDALKYMGDDAFADFVNEKASTSEPFVALPELRGETRESLIGLLDRAAEVGLLTSHGGGYYLIHPALPWFFKGLFDEYYHDQPPGARLRLPAEPDASASRLMATRAFVEAVGGLGGYYHGQYQDGNRDVIAALGAEEANLLHARRLARQHEWWPRVISTMQGLRTLYGHTGQRAEWTRLVEEIVPDFVDPATDGPLPGREDHWSIVTGYHVRLTRAQRDWPRALRLQRVRVDWDRRRVEQLVGHASLLTEQDGDEQAAQRQRDAYAKKIANITDGDRNTIASLGASLHELGEVQREQTDADCVTSYREALDLAELLSLRSEAATAAFNLGRAYEVVPAVRDLDQAERWYRQSLKLFEEGDDPRQAQCHGQLGSVAFARFQAARDADGAEAELLAALNTALADYHQALELLPDNAVNDLAGVHNQLGMIYGTAGDFDRALPHYRESIRLQESAGNLYGAGQTRFNFAIALLQAGKLSDAREYARAALRNFAPYGPGAADMTARAQQLLARIEQALAAGQP